MVPDVPTTVRVRARGMPDSSRCRSTSATQAATSSRAGGSLRRWRSWRRTEPMSMEVAHRCSPSPSTSSVDPPPMSTTSTGSAGAGSCAAMAPE